MGEIWSRISFCFSIFRCFDWLQWEHGTKSCSKRNIRECKNSLGFTKPKTGKRGWKRLSVSFRLTAHRKEASATTDLNALGPGTWQQGLQPETQVAWQAWPPLLLCSEKRTWSTCLFDTVISTMACAPTGKFC